MQDLQPVHLRSRRRLLQLGAGLVLATIFASLLAAWELHNEADREAWQRLQTIGSLVAEQTSDSLRAVDLSLQDIQAGVVAAGAASPDDLRRIAETRATVLMLGARVAALPQVDALAIIGADGRAINSSRGLAAIGHDVSDRDYFVHTRDQIGAATYLSVPALDRATGKSMIFLARRLQTSRGEFLGTAIAAIRLSYFEGIYSRIGLSEGAGVTLMRGDGRVLVQFPHPDQPVTQMSRTSPWYALAQTGGRYISPGFLGGGRQFISTFPLADYPVVINARIAEGNVFAHWRRQVGLLIVGAICAILYALIMSGAVALQFRRMQRQAIHLTRVTAALRRSKSRLLLKSDRLETTLENMGQGLIMVDASRHVVVYNTKALDMFDLPDALMAANPPLADLESHQWLNEVDTDDDLRLRDFQRNDAALLGPCTYERHQPDGRDIEVRSVPIAGGGFVRTYSDITERKAAEESVRYLADHDGLTHLVNRAVFRTELQSLAHSHDDSSWAVLYLDLDHFKEVNDTLGHPVGDRLLRAVAERMRASLREGDTAARLGGDEFAILQRDISGLADPIALAERLIAAMRAPFDLDDHHVMTGISIGIAIGPVDGATADPLLHHADMALYRAKADGRGTYRFFEPSMDALLQARRLLEVDLRAAVVNDEFELFFQPMLSVRTKMLIGFEALLRWRHPTRGLIAPADFIPVAEEIGLIIPIGEWVLAEACRQAASWPADLKVAVNLSPVQFRSDNLVGAIRAALVSSGLLAGRLEVEITESVLMRDTDATMATLHQMHEIGLRIAMDDFGTGYSSLSYLRSFPFDSIKIDQSFVRDLDRNTVSLAIVRAVLDLSRSLGMSVTAEGVETEAQFAILRNEGCAEVQGYLFGKPVAAILVPGLIAQRRSGITA